MAAYSGDPGGEEQPATRFRILVPLDGSALAAQALPVAERLCAQLGGELELLRTLPNVVLPYGASAIYIPADTYQKLEADQEREAATYLHGLAAELGKRGIPAQAHLAWGDPAATILDLAGARKVGLVVMTTHGWTGLARFALGSVADRVVRGGAAPVLLLRSFLSATEASVATAPMLERALVPLDGSPLAASVLYTIALQLAGPVLHEITLLRVADPRDGLEAMTAAEGYLDAERERLLERLAGCHCCVSRQVCANRSPAQVIVECAREEECDLVLMSTHGEAGIGRWAFGGVTDRVLRDGKKPLLLVHPPREAHE
jgi:nucleotide-binding universal stress UspA family protein